MTVRESDFPGLVARLALVAAFAAMVWLCLPPRFSPLLAYLAFVPLALGLRGVRPVPGLLWGWLFGTCAWLAAVHWAANGFVDMLGWGPAASWLGTLILCLFQGLPYALLGLGCGLMRARGREAGPVFCASLLTLFAALRPPLCPGSGFLMLYAAPMAIQTADLGGTALVQWQLMLANWLAADAFVHVFCRGGRGVALARLAALAVLLVCVFGYGAWRLDHFRRLEAAASPDEFVRVTSVQPNVPASRDKGLRDSGPYVGCLGALLETTEMAGEQRPSADLVLWPEVPCSLECSCEDFGLNKVAEIVRAPVMLACVEHDFGGNECVTETRELPDGTIMTSTTQKVAAMYNSVWLVEPDGACGRAYRKVELMPFGERTPFGESWPWLKEKVGRTLEYSPGDGPALVTLAGGRTVQPLLCFESGFSGLVRRGVAMGADVLVNLSDDAWFGSARASKQHLALALFRAVEFRRPLVSCTDSGPGAHIKVTGEIVPGTLTPVWERAATQAALHCPGGMTLCARWGDWWLWVAGVLSLLAILRPRRPHRVEQTRKIE